MLDAIDYANEGAHRRGWGQLRAMGEATTAGLVEGVDRALAPSGHLFPRIDTFYFCQDVCACTAVTSLGIVDLLVWDRGRIGMGYCSRRRREHLLVLNKPPRLAKVTGRRHDIPDV